MQDILFEYELNPTTWAYISALLTIGIYFKFNRVFSLRNFDLLGLIVFSPGLLLIFHGLATKRPDVVESSLEQYGFAWLFAVGLLFLVRLFLDPLMVRRPMLEPNLSASGLTFTGIAIFVFVTAIIVSSRPPDRLEHELRCDDNWPLRSPGYRPFYYLATFTNVPLVNESGTREDATQYQTPRGQNELRPMRSPKPDKNDRSTAVWDYPSLAVQVPLSRTIAILAQLALVLGIVAIGYFHFGNIHTGMAAASLYLLLPYVGQMAGRLDHVVPAALLVWAMAAYRRPMVSGIFLGLAGGLIFFPLFLIPLGCSFYWQRGLRRYVAGVTLALAALILVLFLLAPGGHALKQLGQMFGATIFKQDIVGFWQAYPLFYYRVPVLAVFVVLCASLAIWPAQKNFGTLLSCSATVLLASQFCHAFEGGLYMAWYLPLLVLTAFRPNLEDRVALNAVIERRAVWADRLGKQRATSPLANPGE